jgi:hypothetical protein
MSEGVEIVVVAPSCAVFEEAFGFDFDTMAQFDRQRSLDKFIDLLATALRREFPHAASISVTTFNSATAFCHAFTEDVSPDEAVWTAKVCAVKHALWEGRQWLVKA